MMLRHLLLLVLHLLLLSRVRLERLLLLLLLHLLLLRVDRTARFPLGFDTLHFHGCCVREVRHRLNRSRRDY